MKRGYQAQIEMKSIWNSLETEVLDDIRRKRIEQLHYRLNLIIGEMTTFGVPRVQAESYVLDKIKRHNIEFTPAQPKRGRNGKRVAS